MRKIIYALAILPLAAATALAQPKQLTDRQMDSVNAGFSELDIFNTGLVVVSLFFRPYLTDPTPNFVSCPTCYLVISTPTFSVASSIGQPPTLPVTPP